MVVKYVLNDNEYFIGLADPDAPHYKITFKGELIHDVQAIIRQKTNTPIEDKVFRCTIDGDQLCITREDFVDLQDSPAIFIPIASDDIEDIKKLGGNRKWDINYSWYAL